MLTFTRISLRPCFTHIPAQAQSVWRAALKQALKYPTPPTTTTPSSCANLFHLEVDFIISFEPRPDREVNHFDRPCLKPLQPKPLILSIFGARGRSKSLLAFCGSGVNPGACRVLGPHWLTSKAVDEACLVWRRAERWNLISVAPLGSDYRAFAVQLRRRPVNT